MLKPTRFFCRITAGLEEIVSLDLDFNLSGIISKEINWRRIDFALANNFREVTTLKSVDDVYLYVDELTGIEHTRHVIPTIEAFARKIDLLSHVPTLRHIRQRPVRPTFYVTVSRLGRHNYSSKEVKYWFAQAIEADTKWHEVDDYTKADLNVRILLENDSLLVGLSVLDTPLHRRQYRVCHAPGALKPPVAYLLCQIAGCHAGDVVVDPMCGTGTIVIEAGHLCQEGMLLGADKSITVLHCAHQNWKAAFPERSAYFIDANVWSAVLKSQSATKVISNPPWGKQVQSASLPELYRHLLETTCQIGKAEVVCVLLTDRIQELMQAIQNQSGMTLLWARQISLYGAYPTIVVLGGSRWINREAGAFSKISPLGVGIDQLIEKKGIWQSYTGNSD